MHREAARRTLVADGDKERALLLRGMLVEHDRRVDLTGSLADALTVLERYEHDSLVMALGLFDADGVAGVRAACERRPGLAIVVIDDTDDPETARAVLEVGAQDYFAPGNEHHLPRALDHAVGRADIVKRLHESQIRYRSLIDGLPGCIAIGFDRQLGVTNLEGQASRLSDFRLDYPGQDADEVFGVEAMKHFRPYWERTLAGEAFSVEWKSDVDGRNYASYFAPVHDALGHLLGGVVVGIDINDRLEAESGLAAYRRRHSELAEGVPVGIAEFDGDGVCSYVNGRHVEITGIPVEESIGRLWSDLAHPGDVERMVDEWERSKAEGREFQLDHRARRADGSFVWVTNRAREIFDDAGASIGYLSTISDIEQRRRAEQALREATALFTAAFEHAPVGMGIVGVDGRYQQINQALSSLLGRSAEEIVGHHVDEFVHPEHFEDAELAIDALLNGASQEWEVEGCLAKPDGSPVWTLQRTTVLRTPDGEPTLLFAQMVDIGERRKQELELRRLADHDVLTGLYNRRCFEAELNRHLAEGRRAADAGAVLLLDLNDFKQINDEHGHHVGDSVLIDVAGVLRQRLRRSDVVGRIGGDEFAVLLRTGDEARARSVAEALAAGIAETGTTASIGVAAIDGSAGSADALLVRADRAMYEVKRQRTAGASAAQYFNW